MDNLPKLAQTVAVGGTYYVAGDTPPLNHAKKITNPRNWRGGEVPDFDKYLVDDEDTADGVRNSSAANAQRTGLPGFGPDNERTGGEPATKPAAGAGSDDPDDDSDDDSDETGGDGDGGEGGGTSTTTPAPAKATPRKAAKAAAAAAPAQ